MDPAVQTQLTNIERASGRGLPQWQELLAPRVAAGARHGALVSWLKTEHGLTHGNANLLATLARQAADPQTPEALLARQYAGSREALLPIHDAVVAAVRGLGDDVVVVIQKTGVALRRRKQLGVLAPATRTRVDLGLNLVDQARTGRLEVVGGMCSHRVSLTSVEDVDDEVLGWLQAAYERA